MKKIVMAVGGTGGHIYPAVALADQMKAQYPDIEILFVGGKLSTNPFFNRSGHEWKEISCSPFTFRNPFLLLRQLSNMMKGVIQSRRILHDTDLVIGFGSYYALPVLLAAMWRRLPFFLHEQNSIPGRVNRLLSRWAVITGVHFPNTCQMLTGPSLEVGMPLRTGYQKGCITKADARKYFNLQENVPTLLVFGGSQGAQKMNTKVVEALKLHDRKNLQVIHLIGANTDLKDIELQYQNMGIACAVKSFENRMDAAWQAADAIICRSGAGTIAEQTEFEVPGILIPYPFAMDNHQEKNAEFMVNIIGGSCMILEKDLDTKHFALEIQKLMEKENLEKMSSAIHRYKNKKNLTSFVDLIMNFLNKRKGAPL